VAKTVFLAMDKRVVAVVLPAHARLDPSRVEMVLGRGRARLATEAEIAGWFKGCLPGAVPPLRLRADELILMDRSLAHLGRILFPAGTPETAISVRFRDWYRMLRPGVGRFAVPAEPEAARKSVPMVLVVEDEPDTNELLCRFLEGEGFSCRGVKRGKQAVAVASEVKPAAILLDLMLPDISGFEVCDCLRRDGRLRRTAVVMLTALDDDDSRQRGWDAGAAAYLTKPFEPHALVAELQMAMADAGA
jgi:CheY-like chemotaxis protein/prolyl-tRNA editing enzyme YbaK/EbsC (Cys-tRNA(Pro) deacylase)